MYFKQAEKLFKANRINAASKLYEKVLKRDNGHQKSRFKLGICRFRQKRFSEALQHFDMVLRSQAQNYNAWYYKGLCYERIGSEAKAIEAYKKTLEISPDFKLAKQKLKGKQDVSSGESKIFKDQIKEGPGEVIYEEQNRRLSSYTLHWFLVIVVYLSAVILTFAIFDFSYLLRFFLLSTIILIPIYIDLFLRSYNHRYKLYQKRIEVKKGILFRTHQIFWLYEITEISLTQNPWYVITGNYSINFQTARAGKDKKFSLRGLKKPKESVDITTKKFTEILFQEMLNAVREDRGEVKKIWI